MLDRHPGRGPRLDLSRLRRRRWRPGRAGPGSRRARRVAGRRAHRLHDLHRGSPLGGRAGRRVRREMPVLEDTDLWVRLAILGPFVLLRRRTITRQRPEGSLMDRGRRDRLYFAALERHGLKVAELLDATPGREDLARASRANAAVARALAALDAGDDDRAAAMLAEACELHPSCTSFPASPRTGLWRTCRSSETVRGRARSSPAAPGPGPTPTASPRAGCASAPPRWACVRATRDSPRARCATGRCAARLASPSPGAARRAPRHAAGAGPLHARCRARRGLSGHAAHLDAPPARRARRRHPSATVASWPDRDVVADDRAHGDMRTAADRVLPATLAPGPSVANGSIVV